MSRASLSLQLVPRAPTPDGTDDSQLAAGLLAGDPSAQSAAWNRYAPLVFRLAHRTLGSVDAAEDLTQEVFYRLFLKVPTLRKPSALRSFVVSITVRLLKWELRRRRVRRWVTLSPTGELPETVAEQADPVTRARLRRFYAILDTLGPEERTLFVLRHVERFTLDEIAETTQLSLSTAKRRLAKASAHVSLLVARDPELYSLVKLDGGSHGP